jgi:tetratricopeptide (TPR) repeat protein
MDQTQVKDRTPNMTYFRAAIACEIAGDRSNAGKLFGQMKKADDKDRPREVFQYRLAQKYQRRPLHPPEIVNIKAENEASSGNPERALALYRAAAAASEGSPDARARALYGVVQMAYELKRYPECVAAADSALMVAPEEEIWIPPHVLFKKGQALSRMGRLADAKAAFEAISDHDDYDFQSSLERRTEDELHTLKRE